MRAEETERSAMKTEIPDEAAAGEAMCTEQGAWGSQRLHDRSDRCKV